MAAEFRFDVTADRIRKVGIPETVGEAFRADDYDPTRPAIIRALNFAGDPIRSLIVFSGQPGTGKSVAAAAVALAGKTKARTVRVRMPISLGRDEVADPKDPFKYEEMPVVLGGRSLFIKWQHAVSFFHSIYNEDFWNELRKAPMLVIDDLGAEPQDEKVTTAIVALLCDRVDKGLKTAVTTNLNIHGFKAAYGTGAGARLMDRLDDQSFIAIVGRSMRHRDEEGA